MSSLAIVPSITVTKTINATPEKLWTYLRDIGSHVEWMADAESITFTSDNTEGVGTTFDCLTKVGPIKLNDKMTVTSWVDNKEMGVTHSGIVTGVGLFTLEPAGDKTLFTWSEKLEFPLYLAGPIGAFFAKPILKLIWTRNLSRLSSKFPLK